MCVCCSHHNGTMLEIEKKMLYTHLEIGSCQNVIASNAYQILRAEFGRFLFKCLRANSNGKLCDKNISTYYEEKSTASSNEEKKKFPEPSKWEKDAFLLIICTCSHSIFIVLERFSAKHFRWFLLLCRQKRLFDMDSVWFRVSFPFLIR